MPKKERVRSQRSKGSWPFKSQEAAGVHRSRMICWSSFLDVLDFSKKNSEALNWGDYQMISRWTGVTFVEEAGLNHLRSATDEASYQSMSSRNLGSFRSLSRRTHDWFVHFGLKRNLSPSFSQHFQANLFSSWDTHRAVKQGCNLLNEMGCWMNGFFKLQQLKMNFPWNKHSEQPFLFKLIDSVLSFVFWGLEFPDAVGWCRKGSFDEVESLIDLLPGLLSLSSTGFDVMVHGIKWT